MRWADLTLEQARVAGIRWLDVTCDFKPCSRNAWIDVAEAAEAEPGVTIAAFQRQCGTCMGGRSRVRRVIGGA